MMARPSRLIRLRKWFPLPVDGYEVQPIRWILLDGGRYAVASMLLSLVFFTLLGAGTVWTFEVQQLLTETDAVQSLLDTLLNGIILLVSIVVSINAIVLSYDITSVGSQRERIEESMELRRQIGDVIEVDESPTDPISFLQAMAEVIQQRAAALERATEARNDEFAQAMNEYVKSIEETVEKVSGTISQEQGEFGVLWQGLRMDYGTFMDRSNELRTSYEGDLNEDAQARFDELVTALKLFAVGKEYFKTLYYGREISGLSRSLLVVSLPSILVTATTILVIDSGNLPEIWLFGLPPLLTFVAITVTIALTPFVVLTSYMLRVATVAHETVAAGPFVLNG